MANDLLAGLLDELEELFRPLEEVTRDPDLIFALLRRLGWEIDDLVPAAATLATSLQGITSAIAQVRKVIAGGSPDIGAVVGALQETTKIPDAVSGLKTQLETALPVVANDLAVLPAEILELLFVDWMRRRSPLAFAASVATGLIESQTVAARLDAGNRVLREPVTLDRLHFERLPQWVSDPVGQARGRFGVADLATEADARAYAMRVYPLIAQLMSALGAIAVMGRGLGLRRLSDEDELALAHMLSVQWQPPFDDGVSANIGANIATLSAAETGPGVMFMPFGALELSVTTGGWTGTAELGSNVDALFLKASGAEFLGGGAAELTGAIGIARAGAHNRFGGEGGTRLELGDISLGAQFRIMPTVRELSAELNFSKAVFVVSGGDGDGFLQKVLPKDGFRADFDLAIGWSNRKGLYFRGSAGLEATLPVHKELLGVLKVDSVYLALRAKEVNNQALIETVAAATASIKLGPFSANVERMGLQGKLSFSPNGGNLGPINLELGFKPPDGLGLVVDAGPITGGGYLSIDTANGRYTGVLQLSVGNNIAITAIGLLDTKLPGGAKGFSFLIIITAKFSPIQLGFGFALTGLGGLAGIHRSIVVQALQDGVRSHSLDHILVPEDPVKNAQKLISDLQAFFPPTEGSYVFGPMASISWGTPVIIEAELGIILQLPNPLVVVILGQVNVILPDKEAPVAAVVLHIDIVGSIDFTNQNLSIDASLHDSKLLQFSLYGDMALRLSWGKEPNFALSVGGLHPQFQPPPDFPTTLKRLTVALGAGENPRFSLQTYLAVTSNTVQFGALAELYAEAAGFNVYGWIGFDVLFIFTPFSLTADFSAGVALRRGSTVLASVHLAATLTGPTPWHAWGEASISILFLKATVSFDAVFGEEAQLEAPLVDPWPVLEAEIKKTGNWSATLPPASSQVVTLTAPGADEPDLALIDPLGGLTLREKAVPFDRTLTKFGEGKLVQPQRFTIGGVTVGTQPATTGNAVLDYFSPGQFEEMTDAVKLSRSSFEQMQGGVMIASDAVAFGSVKGTEYEYKTVIIDKPDTKGREAQAYTLKVNHQAVSLQRSAAAQSPMRTTGLDKLAPAPSEPALAMLAEEEYVVVATATCVERTDIKISTPKTKGAAYRSLADYLAKNPKDKGQLEVVPTHELQEAA